MTNEHFRCAECEAYEAGYKAGRAAAEVTAAGSAGIAALGVDHHGEVELRLSVDGREGSVFVSKDFWVEVGRIAGWTIEGLAEGPKVES